MSKEVLVIVFGIFTGLSPFMGLPGDWRTIFVVLLGLGLVVIGFFLRSETLSRGGVERSSFFIDNRHSSDTTESDYSNTQNTRIQ